VSELASLPPKRFDLAADLPAVTVAAGYTKNRKEATQPLSPVLAKLLAPWLATLCPGRPVFDLPDRTADMIGADLAVAGIPYETPSGVVDFHALRSAYISYLVASGASVKTCQTLARHSTPSVTVGIYIKASLHDIRGAVAPLPDLTPDRTEPEARAATGTDPATPLPPNLAAPSQRAGDGSERNLAEVMIRTSVKMPLFS
jgi:integrase